jgi:hypothetical protein
MSGTQRPWSAVEIQVPPQTSLFKSGFCRLILRKGEPLNVPQKAWFQSEEAFHKVALTRSDVMD